MCWISRADSTWSEGRQRLMAETIAELAAARMAGSPAVVSCRRMPSGFANANYRLETSAGVVLLRHRTVQDRAEVLFELDVLEWLGTQGFPAPAALRFDAGDRWIAGPDDTYLVLLEWLEGAEPELQSSTVTTIARALGDLHRLPSPSGDWWRRKNPYGQLAVAPLAESTGDDLPEHFAFFAEEFALLRDRLGAPLPVGFIHGDLFPDNTLFRGEELVAILDFEAACEDALLFDVAMAIHGFCFPDEQWSPELADAFVGAYSERRPLDEAEREALPTYLRWCPLAMMGWHLQELIRRPDEGNERRAAEFARRITTMREENWAPSWD